MGILLMKVLIESRDMVLISYVQAFIRVECTECKNWAFYSSTRFGFQFIYQYFNEQWFRSAVTVNAKHQSKESTASVHVCVTVTVTLTLCSS